MHGGGASPRQCRAHGRLDYLGQGVSAKKISVGAKCIWKLLKSLFADCPCLPYDDNGPPLDKQKQPGALAATVARPSDLYTYSAELKAFEGAGTFNKVSSSLQKAGVTEEFLLQLGVRKSVAVDFLFANLDTLQWSRDPKPLLEYLRAATLTRDDYAKLARSKYLPAELRQSPGGSGEAGKAPSVKPANTTYAPSELYLPSVDLRIFPFCTMLLWPSEPELSDRSENGHFLVNLGMKTMASCARLRF